VATLNKFGSKIYFPANSAQIIGKKTIDVLMDIKNILSENPKGNIIIEGYASSDGDEEFNIKLSVKRAKAVLNYLIGLGVSSERLEAEGFGELDPLGDNTNPQGRAINRRVQFKPKRD
jgi:outer membrane protein OmpA-like peptidoglycan-associated protein